MSGVPGSGLARGLAVTLKTMLHPSVTEQYPDVKPQLPPRSRGVIGLLEENCTVCMLCARECPDWCIYIDSHKETVPATEPGARARTRNVLDRFGIDFALCMYCGICIEVCPFDALFWSPEFEYAAYEVTELTHERDRLREWMWTVPPPSALDAAGEPAKEIAAAEKAGAGPAAGAARTPRPERPPRADGPERPARGDRPERAARGDRPDRAARGEGAARGGDETERPPRADRPERAVRPGRLPPPPAAVAAPASTGGDPGQAAHPAAGPARPGSFGADASAVVGGEDVAAAPALPQPGDMPAAEVTPDVAAAAQADSAASPPATPPRPATPPPPSPPPPPESGPDR